MSHCHTVLEVVLVPYILVANTETVAELQQAGVPVVAAHSHQAALGVDLSAVESLVRNLYSEEVRYLW